MPEKNQSRILILGLDGVTWDVLIPWLEDGSLPNLEKLRRSGRWGNLLSTLPPLTAPAWTSFMTGKNPGKHGIFHFINQQLDDTLGTSLTTIVNSNSIKSSTLWDILGHHHHKVGIINLPMTYPPRAVNGFMIAGFLTPPGTSIFTYPPSLSQELTDYQIDLDRFISNKPFASKTGKEKNSKTKIALVPSVELVQEFHKIMEKRARTSFTLMDAKPWDVFMCVFMGPDRLGHYLWQYHRAVDLDGNQESLEIHQAIHAYYRRLDEIIGEFVQRLEEKDTVVVLSDHGMGPNTLKRVHWNYWLWKEEMLSTQGHNLSNADSLLLHLKISRNKLGRVIRKLPIINQSRLINRMRNSRAIDIDIKNSKAYYKLFYGQVGGIYINAPRGSAQYEDLRHRLMKTMMEIIDPMTGEPVVRWVYKGEDCYFGPNISDVPAIVLVLHPSYQGSDRLASYSSPITVKYGNGNSGDHQIEGIFVMAGPSVQAATEPLSNITITDVMPTILHLLNLPIPSDLDGRVMVEAFVSQSPADRPVVQGEPLGIWNDPDAEPDEVSAGSSQDDIMIRKRLEELGYLD